MKIFLETERLVLRTFTEDDSAMILDLCQDPKVMAFTGERPYNDLQEADNLLQTKLIPSAENEDSKYWAVHLLKNGIFIGWCGWQIVNDEPYIDCRLRKRFWNKGFGTELTKALINYTFTELKLNQIFAKSHEKNLAAIEVMQKSGMKHLKTKKVKRQRFVTYNLTRKDWNAKKLQANTNTDNNQLTNSDKH